MRGLFINLFWFSRGWVRAFLTANSQKKGERKIPNVLKNNGRPPESTGMGVWEKGKKRGIVKDLRG